MIFKLDWKGFGLVECGRHQAVNGTKELADGAFKMPRS